MSDLEESRKRLDKLYQIMGVEQITTRCASPCPNGGEGGANKLFVFHHHQRGKNLQPKDDNDLSDPYVVLQYNDTPFARTDYVSETLNSPRWDKVVGRNSLMNANLKLRDCL